MQNGMVEEAFKALNRIMGAEGLLDLWRRTRSYEKPCDARRRLNWEKSKAIYDEDMRRKINFVMRANREDPWLARGPLYTPAEEKRPKIIRRDVRKKIEKKFYVSIY